MTPLIVQPRAGEAKVGTNRDMPAAGCCKDRRVASIAKFSIHRREGDAAPAHLARLLPGLRSWRDYYIETTDELSPQQRVVLSDALVDSLIETIDLDVALDPTDQVQVSYKRGIVDNENDTIIELSRALGIPAVAARVATTYQSNDARLAEVIEAEACNHNIEEMHLEEPHYGSLQPIGVYSPMQQYDLRALDDEQMIRLGADGGRNLDLAKMRKIREIQVSLGLGSVSDVLLEALAARWSDHCAHTTWKSLGNLLGKLIDASVAAANPNVVSMFRDNAGIWEFYDGYGIAIKAETHNGPSAVSAYFGQLTKVGGVLRDILGTGLGADPIGVFEYSATGPLDSPSPVAGRPTPKQIAHETIRAVKEYGNTFGVPMMWSHMTFHPFYRAKPFALGGSIGLIPLDRASKGSPVAGDLVMLIGGLTGNDGIHGATGSSAGAAMDTTAVQIGSPLEAIKFREAILDLRDHDCIRAITDLGAAGLNSAVGEMGEDVGVWINTALVPLKTGGLPMWRVLLSESQERMLIAIPSERLAETRSILDRHEVRNAVIGRFTGNDRYCVVHDDDLSEKHVVEMDIASVPPAREVGFDVPYEMLSFRPDPISVDPPRQKWTERSLWPSLSPDELVETFARIVADGELQSQALAVSQYDSSVQGRSFYGPEVGTTDRVATGYFACRPLYGSQQALVLNTVFNPWLYQAHPVHAARQSFLSALLTQVLAGVAVTDVSLCDNFYTPHLTDDGYSWLVGMVNELANLSQQFRTPFISGKDSSAGSTNTDEGVISVPPAVFLTALGKVPHVELLRDERWQSAGNLLVRIGLPTPSLAGTAAARVFALDANDVDEVHPQTAYTFLDELSQVPLDVIVSGRVIAAGGIAGTAMLSSLASGLSADLEVPSGGSAELLVEHRCAALVEVPSDKLAELSPSLMPVVVGRVADRPGPSVNVGDAELLTSAVLESWRTTFEKELS